MDNFLNLLNTIILSIILSLSIFLKFTDREYVEKWLGQNVSKVGAKFVFYSILFVESSMLIVVFVLGPTHDEINVLISLVLFLVACSFKVFFPKVLSGCPCFGVLSNTESYNQFNFFGGLFFLELVLFYLSASVKIDSPEFCFAMASIAVFIYIFVDGSIKKQVFGQNLSEDHFSKSGPVRILVNENDVFIIIFLSLKCSICMEYLKFLEGYTAGAGGSINIYIHVDGMNLIEPRKYGGSILMPGEQGLALRREFDIKTTPCAVFRYKKDFQKCTGIGSCNVALSELMRKSFCR